MLHVKLNFLFCYINYLQKIQRINKHYAQLFLKHPSNPLHNIFLIVICNKLNIIEIKTSCFNCL